MHWQLIPGDRVRFRALGADHPEAESRVGKALHILNADLQLVPVYIVESDAGETLILGDGEIVEKLEAVPKHR
jgi:hypothetical protein